MKPTVSIIIPVYQVEKYLDKCIASVVGQTYQNLQIILVDDGSTDRSPAICDGRKERDPRITVVHQPNGGLSRARNAGLKLATGEFIGFVDSDDWIEPDMVETLLTALQETDADIAVGGFEGFTEDSQSIHYAKTKSTKRSLCSTGEAAISSGTNYIGEPFYPASLSLKDDCTKTSHGRRRSSETRNRLSASIRYSTTISIGPTASPTMTVSSSGGCKTNLN